MHLQPKLNSNEPIRFSALDRNFAGRINKKSRVNTNKCYYCLSCSCGCPFSDHMDYKPHQIIRLIQLGMKEEALSAGSIWLCVGCYTCSMNCPQAINMAAVMDTLRETAISENYPIKEPDVLAFHQEVLNSIKKYGRTHKIEIMTRYKIKKRDWFSDMDLAFKMFAKKKLDLMPSKVKNVSEIKQLFSHLEGVSK